MEDQLDIVNSGDWSEFLEALGRQFNATVQLARIFGKRWSYVAGPTDSEAGLLGMLRFELGDGYGIIIFPRQSGLDAAPIVKAVQSHKESIRKNQALT